jgi:mono/diheme cytochrome c family protein
VEGKIAALLGLLLGTGAVPSVAQTATDPAPASARADFLELCADCHGWDAKGGGELAGNLHVPPPDLTRIKQRANGVFDDTAVFDWIIGLKMPHTHGTRDMPIWGDWLMDQEMEDSTSMEAARIAKERVTARVMGIVRYLETIQAQD